MSGPIADVGQSRHIGSMMSLRSKMLVFTVAALVLIGASSNAPIRIKAKDWVTPPSSETVAACAPKQTDVDLTDGVSLTCRVSRAGSLVKCTATGKPAHREWALCLSRELRVKRHLVGKNVVIPIRQVDAPS